MVDVNKIEKMMQLMIQNGFDALHAEGHNEKISLSRNGVPLVIGGVAPAHTQAVNSTTAPETSSPADLSSKINPASHPNPEIKEDTLPPGETVVSPFVGTFYRAPGPDAKPFVEIGTKVKKGQPLCIVEAMKLMNEIESEHDGEIVAILLENGRPVEFGSPLFVISQS